MFPVKRPGEYITANWELFNFCSLFKKNNFLIDIIFFHTKKEWLKTKIAATRWTGNKLF